jgi:hypothetical protein
VCANFDLCASPVQHLGAQVRIVAGCIAERPVMARDGNDLVDGSRVFGFVGVEPFVSRHARNGGRGMMHAVAPTE